MAPPKPDSIVAESYAKLEGEQRLRGDKAWGELKIGSVTASEAKIQWPVFTGPVDVEYRLTFYYKGGGKKPAQVASQWYFCPGFKPTEDLVDVADDEMTLQVGSLSADTKYNLVLCVRSVTGSMEWIPQLRGGMHTEPAVPDVMVEVAARFGGGAPVSTATVSIGNEEEPQKLFIWPYPAPYEKPADAHRLASSRAASEGFVAAEHAVDQTLYGTRETRNYEVSKHGSVIAHGEKFERIAASARSASAPKYPKYTPFEGESGADVALRTAR
jgi:hypothetical protein